MQPGFYGQTFPTQWSMPYGGTPFAPPTGMPFTPPEAYYGGQPFMPPTSMPYGGFPFTPDMGTGNFTSPYGAFHCPLCGYSGPVWHSGASPNYAWPGAYPFTAGFGGLGGLRRHGGSYSPQFAATGLPTDEEIIEMVFDAMDVDPLIPYDADIDVECDAGVVILTGTVPNKRVKHAAGDDSWWVPGVVDVRNDLQVSGRRRARSAPPEREERRT